MLFTKVFMLNICDGDVKIEESCSLPLLAPNGTFLIFTDTAIKTKYITSGPLSIDYLTAYEVISKTHRMLAL